ncbi:hypothetical protein [Streptomyces sp. NPDC006012]
MDEALKDATRPSRRRSRIGRRMVAGQLLYVLAVTAFFVSLLCYDGD